MPRRKVPPFFGVSAAKPAELKMPEASVVLTPKAAARRIKSRRPIFPSAAASCSSSQRFMLYLLLTAADTMSGQRLLRNGSSGEARAVLNQHYGEKPNPSQQAPAGLPRTHFPIRVLDTPPSIAAAVPPIE